MENEMTDLQAELHKLVSSFPFLKAEEVDIIVEKTNLKAFKKGHVLLSEGEIAKECYAVVKGCVREYRLKDGQEKTTAFFTEGQSVNSFSSYTNQLASKHYLVCAEDCVLTVGTQSLIDQMCERLPRLQEFLSQEVEKEAGALQERMAFFISSSPEERFKDLMENNPQLMNRVPQHQIASYLGITPESMSRIKKRAYQKK
tara:strand:- start:3429 stop:4028 length:600 start_codon:yes stop_codon:yes gene_type:complete